VTSFYHCLLQRLAFSESRHFSWDVDPANTMVRRLTALSPTTEAIRVMSCGKNLLFRKKLTSMMVRYRLRCKNSLLLLKLKFLLRVGDKNSFFLFNSRFYFIIFICLHCYITIVFSSLNGATLWKLIFLSFVPH
jgi:hypothetical protein